LQNGFDYSDPKILFDSLSNVRSKVNCDLEKLAKLCELNKNLHFHLSRHSFAVIALKKGMRIEYLSKILTHSDIKTTQVYAKVVSSELDKAMDIFND
jgi:site-specific recombinase XerD